jgi:hypothetical protein
LSFEIVAHANTMAVTNRANAISAGAVSGDGSRNSTSTVANVTIERMPTPEIGLFDAPMRPAM